MANLIESFLSRFVAETDRDEARESMSELFGELHASLARDFLKSYSEKKPKAEPKAAKKEVPTCQAKTAKGEDCPRKVCEESEECCAMHLKQSQKPKAEPKKAKAEKKPKASKKGKAEKKVAEHNHVMSEKIEESVSDNCDLCQTHGNTLDPDLVDEDFEGVSEDMQSRLQEILSNISELDEAEKEEESVAGPSKLSEEDGEYDEGEILDMPDIDAGLQSDEEEEEEEEEEGEGEGDY